MQPYYQDKFVTIHHADCRDIIQEVKDVDLVVTDPPYGIALNANYSQTRKGMKKKSTSIDWQAIKNDDEVMNFEFLFAIDAVKVIFGANNFPQQIPFDAKRDGWLVWDKRMSEAADRILGSPFEMAVVIGRRTYKMIRLQHAAFVNADGKNARRVHPTQKPVALVSRIMALFPKSKSIFDPFCGSGSTLRAAKDRGKRAIGIEVEERFCEVAAKLCSQEVMGFEDEAVDDGKNMSFAL